jgi:hypothetical protein
MVGFTVGVQSAVALVGRPVVVHDDAGEQLQQAEGIARLGAAFGVGKCSSGRRSIRSGLSVSAWDIIGGPPHCPVVSATVCRVGGRVRSRIQH